MKIHTFGDSHSREPWSKIKINELPILYNVILDKKSNQDRDMTMTCSFFGFEKLNAINIKNYNVNDEDIVCFSLGEVDCRCHIHKYKENYEEIINKIINNYFLAIKLNEDQFKNLKICVISIPPPVSKKDYTNKYGYPMLGEDEHRVKYTKYMNLKIKENCEIYNYSFLNIYDEYCDNKGLLNPLYSDNICHIIDPIFAKQKLFKILDEYNIKDKILNYIIEQFGDEKNNKNHYTYCKFPEEDCTCIYLNEITYDTSLINGGYIDSFSMMIVLIFIENTFNIKISDNDSKSENFDTVNKIFKMIKKYI